MVRQNLIQHVALLLYTYKDFDVACGLLVLTTMSAVVGPSRLLLDADHAETELLRSTLAVLSTADAAGLEFRQGRTYLSDRDVALQLAHEEVSTFQRRTADRVLAERLQMEETGGQHPRLEVNR